MRVRSVCSLALACGLLVFGTAWANHFTIELKVETAKGSKVARGETLAPGAKPKLREVLTAEAGQKVTVRWALTNASAGMVKNVLVHFFVVREEKLGQSEVPKLTKDVVAESAVTVDFAPKETTKGDLTFTIDQAGAYLVRVETIGASTPGAEDHEHFAALDVTIP